MMSTLPNSKTASGTDNAKAMVAAALNEHGFLLQQAVWLKIQARTGDSSDKQDEWSFVATEYPVTAADGSQTRIDLLLKHRHAQGVHICMECKRPNPKYKRWVFFGSESGVAGVYEGLINLETISWTTRPAQQSDIRHRLVRHANLAGVQLFCYYVEAALKRDPGGKQSISSTETIEKAFCQVMKGHSGLMAKFAASTDGFFFRSIPVVDTTAELIKAAFDPKRISVEDGTIDPGDLEILPLPYCAVNYRADDNLSLQMLTPHERSVGVSDLLNAQIRTVFVVHATALNEFLNWAGRNLIDPR
jgi:hypothetical protein